MIPNSRPTINYRLRQDMNMVTHKTYLSFWLRTRQEFHNDSSPPLRQ